MDSDLGSQFSFSCTTYGSLSLSLPWMLKSEVSGSCLFLVGTARGPWDDAGSNEDLSGDFPTSSGHGRDRSFCRASLSLASSSDRSLESHAMSSSCGLFGSDTNSLKRLYPGAERKVATLVPGPNGTVRRYLRCCHSSTTESAYVEHHIPLVCGKSSLAI